MHVSRTLFAVAILAVGMGRTQAQNDISWEGADGTNPTFWDINTTPNWTGDATVFANGDHVTFNNDAIGTDVDVQGTVEPGSITISGSNDFKFLHGTIDGSGTLTMEGTGMAEFGNLIPNARTATDRPNMNHGDTVITSGIVRFNLHGESPSFGSGTITIDGGEFQYTNTGANAGDATPTATGQRTLSNAFHIGANGGTIMGRNTTDGNRSVSVHLTGQFTGAGGELTLLAGGDSRGLNLYFRNQSNVSADISQIRVRELAQPDGWVFFDGANAVPGGGTTPILVDGEGGTRNPGLGFVGNNYTSPIGNDITYDDMSGTPQLHLVGARVGGTDRGIYTFTGNLDAGTQGLSLTGDAVMRYEPDGSNSFTNSGTTFVRDSTALHFRNVATMPSGPVELVSGLLIVDGAGQGSGTAPSFAEITAAKPLGTGLLLTGGGFAARGSGDVLTGLPMDRNLTIGSRIRDADNNLYANAPLTLPEDAVLTANRTWQFAGDLSISSSGTTTLSGPVHQVSGNISGTDMLSIVGDRHGTSMGGGGIVRFTGDNSGFSGTWRVGHHQRGDTVVTIFAGEDSTGTGEIRVGGTGDSSHGLVLFEDPTGTGSTFANDLVVVGRSGGSNRVAHKGFGSYAGDVTYTGDITLSQTNANSPVNWQVHTDGASVLRLDGASLDITGGPDMVQNWFKGGTGTFVIEDIAYTTSGSRNINWNIRQGTLIYNDTSDIAWAGMTIHSSASLGGSGSFAVPSLTTGAELLPGSSVGTLNLITDLTVASGTTYVWELDRAGPFGPTITDLVAVDGDLNLMNGWTVAPLDLSGFVADASEQFDLFTFTGDLFLNGVLQGPGSGFLDEGTQFNFDFSGLDPQLWDTSGAMVGFNVGNSGNVFLTGITGGTPFDSAPVIPEPSTGGLVFLAAAVLMRLRRRMGRRIR